MREKEEREREREERARKGERREGAREGEDRERARARCLRGHLIIVLNFSSVVVS
jgi:hypothetical protein